MKSIHDMIPEQVSDNVSFELSATRKKRTCIVTISLDLNLYLIRELAFRTWGYYALHCNSSYQNSPTPMPEELLGSVLCRPKESIIQDLTTPTNFVILLLQARHTGTYRFRDVHVHERYSSIPDRRFPCQSSPLPLSSKEYYTDNHYHSIVVKPHYYFIVPDLIK